MVRYENILLMIDEYILKCYPKENALKYFNEHKDNFKEEKYNGDGLGVKVTVSGLVAQGSLIGELQRVQEDLQNTIDYPHSEVMSALAWNSGHNFIWINSYERGMEDWYEQNNESNASKEELLDGIMWGDIEVYDALSEGVSPVEIFGEDGEWDDYGRKLYDHYLKYEPMKLSIPQITNNLKSAINKSELQNDTVVYRVGELDESLEINGHGVLKGFTSTTYNKNYIDSMKEGYDWMKTGKNYTIKIYAPKGTKGAVFGDNKLGDGDMESELLFNSGQKYVLFSKDDNTM